MKILRVISSVNPHGGGPIEGIKQAQKPLIEMGVELEIACCDPPNAEWLTNVNLPIVHALGPPKNNYGYTAKLLPWLKENSHRFDLIIVHGLWQYHGFAVWLALSGTNTPYYVFTHGMLDPWFKRTYPLKHLKKWLYWPWGEYRILRDALYVIFTSEDERFLSRKSFWLYKVNEIVIPYGTSIPPSNKEELSLEFLNENEYLKGKRIVLFLSRIHEKKGCDANISIRKSC